MVSPGCISHVKHMTKTQSSLLIGAFENSNEICLSEPFTMDANDKMTGHCEFIKGDTTDVLLKVLQ